MMIKILGFLVLGTSALYITQSQVHAGPERDALLVKYNTVSPKLTNNHFGLPIALESSERNRVLKGEVIGVINHDMNDTRQSLLQPAQWCNLLILHLNTKACTYESGPNPVLHWYSGKKEYRTPKQATKFSLTFNVVKNEADYLSVRLFSENGPIGISDSLIELEATDLPPELYAETSGRRTLIRLVYSYQSSIPSELATRFYLATLARNKVGFTVLDNTNNQPKYIQGKQGIIERNTIRYFLAILTRLEFRSSQHDMADQFEHWFEQTERYHRQLYEIPKEQYMAAKKKELINQRNEQAKIIIR
ncbi:MAG: hypothetical protein ACJAUL_003328 [Paraglaciecola sp.]|jgi:hypothetical protein